MITVPTVLVISDYPIVQTAVDRTFRHRYQIVPRTWSAQIEAPWCTAEISILDVTRIDRTDALHHALNDLRGGRIVLCSLYDNEVHVYRHELSGLCMEAALPSLLSLSA